ncbi:hypothetical protein HRbin22_02228 [Candidatus Thermoflexus japonica]|uniref:Uncharacterized protein n=1 Tax=Candidatus Thermoflexus japonica TaxID=2035417 RepID=A0A2H5Y934_9CHLR|nr:hypothetical protein HRbin22_02228 [Candidatus Thermoflexus japonica]
MTARRVVVAIPTAAETKSRTCTTLWTGSTTRQ